MQGSLPVFYGCWQGRPHLCLHHGRRSARFHLSHVLVRSQCCQSEWGCTGGLHGESNSESNDEVISKSLLRIAVVLLMSYSQLLSQHRGESLLFMSRLCLVWREFTLVYVFYSCATRSVWMHVHPAWPPACPLLLLTQWLDVSRKGCRVYWAASRATGQALSPPEPDRRLHKL